MAQKRQWTKFRQKNWAWHSASFFAFHFFANSNSKRSAKRKQQDLPLERQSPDWAWHKKDNGRSLGKKCKAKNWAWHSASFFAFHFLPIQVPNDLQNASNKTCP